MKIKERIITLIEEQKDEKSANLWNICQKIIDNSTDAGIRHTRSGT